jgi:hypothetical protein
VRIKKITVALALIEMVAFAFIVHETKDATLLFFLIMVFSASMFLSGAIFERERFNP